MRSVSPLRWLGPWLFAAAGACAVCCGGSAKDGDAAGEDGTDLADSDGLGDVGDVGDTGDTGEGGTGSGCGGLEVKAEPAAAHVLLVIDKSGSMNDTPQGFSKTKWETLVTSLTTALGEVEGDVAFGLKLYPDGDTDSDVCAVEGAVPIGVSLTSLSDIESALDDVGVPGGQTPTASALAAALEYFSSSPGKDLEGAKYVLLATDGGPNCNAARDSCVIGDCGNPYSGGCESEAASCTLNLEDRCGESACPSGSVCTEASQCLDDEATLAQVKSLDAAGIKTIVVGMSGSEAYGDVLDALAVAGKLPASATSPKYHKVTDATGLTETLRDITKTVIRSCDISLEEAPPALDQVNVFLDGTVVPKKDADGWKFNLTTTPASIELTGEICTQVETQGVSAISVEFGCPTVTVR